MTSGPEIRLERAVIDRGKPKCNSVKCSGEDVANEERNRWTAARTNIIALEVGSGDQIGYFVVKRYNGATPTGRATVFLPATTV